jgi:hypothetical protein
VGRHERHPPGVHRRWAAVRGGGDVVRHSPLPPGRHAATPAASQWQCWFAQYVLPWATTPFFITNSGAQEWWGGGAAAWRLCVVATPLPVASFAAADEWQTDNVLMVREGGGGTGGGMP